MLSKVRLLSNVPFDLSYQHTRYFQDKVSQESYFNSMPVVKEQTAPKHIRIVLGEYKAEGSADELITTNYMTFVNDRKTYFAFVTEIIYVNESTSLLKFEIDVIQTFMFDIEFKQSFIEREHCKLWNSDGSPVINTVPENFDLGKDYNIVTTLAGDYNFYNDIFILITTTEPLENDDTEEAVSYMSGVPSPLYHYISFFGKGQNRNLKKIKVNTEDQNSTFSLLNEFLMNEQNTGKVVSMKVLPFLPFEHSFTSNATLFSLTSGDLRPIITNTVGDGFLFSRIISNGFLPKYDLIKSTNYQTHFNKEFLIKESKLCFYPYSYLSLVDNNGGMVDLYPQYIKGKDISITGKTSIDPVFKANYFAENYRVGGALSSESSLISNIPYDFPILNDLTATYLQGNRNALLSSNATSIASGLGSVAIGGVMAGMGNPMGVGVAFGGAITTVKTISNEVGKREDIKNKPDNLAQQTSNSLFNIADNKSLPYLLFKQISVEKLEIIQDFFHAYGYATHKIKVPNRTTRRHFNYVKTIGANITGKVPKLYLDRIKTIYDNGITLWHTNDMYNYNLENGVR